MTYTTWHRAYCRWYDHREAGHRIRAAAWGWTADRLVNLADALIAIGVARDSRLI